MTIEEKLKNMILERYGSVSEFTKQIDMANSTFATIMKNGVHKANVSNIIKICKALDISADELANDRIVPSGKRLQSQTLMTDIEEIITFTKMNIMTYDNLTLNGEPMTNEDKKTMMDALELCVEFIKRKHKREKDETK